MTVTRTPRAASTSTFKTAKAAKAAKATKVTRTAPPAKTAKAVTPARHPAAKTIAPARKRAPAAKAPPAALKPVTKVNVAAPKSENKPEQRPEPKLEVKEKLKKIKLVRDSFTMPEAEYAVLGEVKKACLKAGVEVKKSELLRVGVALIRQLDIARLQEVLSGLPALKTGRPKKNK